MSANRYEPRIPHFRRISQITPTKRGGGSNASFRDFWQPPIDSKEGPAQIILYPGKYLLAVEVDDEHQGHSIQETESPIYPFFQHFIPRGDGGKSITCSAGLQVVQGVDKSISLAKGSQKCFICEEPKLNRPSFNYIYNVIVLGDFHCIEYEENGWPRTRWEHCAGRDCKSCRRGEPVILHRRAFWKMPEVHADTLRNYELTKFQYRCQACAGEMIDAGAKCFTCGDILMAIDTNNPEINAADFRSYLQVPIHCKKCNSFDYPEPIRLCSRCEEERSMEIWDVRLEVSRQEIGNAGRRGKRTQLQIFEWQPLSPKERDIVKQLGEPFDFASMKQFSPLSLTEQRELLADRPRDYYDREDRDADRRPYGRNGSRYGRDEDEGRHQVDYERSRRSYRDRDEDEGERERFGEHLKSRFRGEAGAYDRPSFMDRRREEEEEDRRPKTWRR